MSENDKHQHDSDALMARLASEYRSGFSRWMATQPPIEQCLPLTRAQTLAFAPSQMLMDERRHLGECGYCTRLVEKFRQAGHPSSALVIAGADASATAEDAEIMERHLAACPECAALRQSRLFERVSRFLRDAVQQVEALPAWAAQLVTGSLSLPPRAEAFGEDSGDPGAQFTRGELSLGIENAGAELAVTAAFREPSSGYNRIAVRLSGETVTREFDIELKSSGGMLAGGIRIPNEWGQDFDSAVVRVIALPWRSPDSAEAR